MRKTNQAGMVDKYISAFPKNIQSLLQAIRRTIKEAAPEAEETISYRMPAYKLKGSYVVYFAAFKKHIGLYPPVPGAFQKETSRYSGPKGNLRFPIDEWVPLDLVKRLVRYKAKEIQKG